MTRPTRIPREVITRGQSFTEPYTLLNADGTAKDLSTKRVLFRFTPQAGGASVQKDTDNAGETGFATDGTDGVIYPVLDSVATLALSLGFYDLNIWVFDAVPNPDDEKPLAEGLIEVVDPSAGAPT